MAKGYMGKILWVDLSTGQCHDETIPDQVYEQYLSGSGLGAYILSRDIPDGADPLGPDNILGLVSGLLTGTGSLFTGRWMAVGKSPLTGGYGEANCGGNFSPAIKRSGYDGIFFKGISKKPVYLYIHKGKPELRPAKGIWGMDCIETEKKLIEMHRRKRKPRVACIGPAGEKVSFIAGISNDLGRMAARSGLGSVMGVKRLKAVVIDSGRPIKPCYPDRMRNHSRSCNTWVKFQPPFLNGSGLKNLGALMRLMPTQTLMDGILFKIMLRKWGTVSLNQFSIESGDAPIKNWKGCNKDFTAKLSNNINADRMIESEAFKYHCYSCPLGCGGICRGDFPGGETHKPEYESVLALSGLCLNDDMESVFQMNDLLNRAGMDTISAGTTVAFAIECFENKMLTEKDTQGLTLRWGDHRAIMALIRKMIAREGIGDILADGVKRASERIGKGSEAFAIHAGGQELPMHDSRLDPGFAVHYSVEPTPGRHTIGSQLYYEMFQLWKRLPELPKAKMIYFKRSKYKTGEDKSAQAAACSKFMNVLNGAGGCAFGAMIGIARFPIFEWLNAATGWNRSPREYMAVGERIQTLKQQFNITHGLDPKDSRVHDRALGSPAQTRGANKNRTVEVDTLMAGYWRQFHWDPKTGKPKAQGMEG